MMTVPVHWHTLLKKQKRSATPNSETITGIQETDEMIKNDTGQRFEGSAADFIKTLLEK